MVVAFRFSLRANARLEKVGNRLNNSWNNSRSTRYLFQQILWLREVSKLESWRTRSKEKEDCAQLVISAPCMRPHLSKKMLMNLPNRELLLFLAVRAFPRAKRQWYQLLPNYMWLFVFPVILVIVLCRIDKVSRQHQRQDHIFTDTGNNLTTQIFNDIHAITK